ncbi:MAG: DNA helicase [Reyranella sp.]|uniref:Z1 domain-containing protein n=1 Tax=Reyranella sp. TaxID=1929291 RepID=UPI001214C557|nr:Z1 domain-containing protein [Reyranella sp.]TAJ98266.1 MAG: DNA helicase [Reyranella sp.]
MSWSDIVGNVGNNQYKERIQLLNGRGVTTTEIEHAVDGAIANLKKGAKSFVIFGEPQSGKTEMMIALNARLLDEGYDVVINLLTDSVDLLQQSLSRFGGANLSPSPKEFKELPTDAKKLVGKQWIIFSKKNSKDLEKLNESLRFMKKLVVIDDEADYASPNGKVNQADRTRINRQIYDLLGTRGHYIGVTATPARLDLNNTFDNATEDWINFKPHASYVGQEFFFPHQGELQYKLFPFAADEGDERREIQRAVFHFLCGVAEQHQRGVLENFSMLVHTSGKIDEHNEDVRALQHTIEVLSDPRHASFARYCRKLEKLAPRYSESDPHSIIEFVLRNINKHRIFLVNSKGKKANVTDLLKPTSLFSFGVGGNIISRGVTFENLLSMYFTRSVKGKFTQDTYIQRARMFGARNKYKEFFQLWIPEDLIGAWNKCFLFHKLAVEAIRSGKGAPVWLSDHKTTPTSPASIDRSSVDFEGGEMSFGIFDFDEAKFDRIMAAKHESDVDHLQSLRKALSADLFPDYILDFITADVRNSVGQVCFHSSSEFGQRAKTYTPDELANIRRKKGIFSNNEFRRGARPDARHHLKIFFNSQNKARLYYKMNGDAVRFIQNRK